MNRRRIKTLALNFMLVLGSLLFCFIIIEAGFRILNPFPYFTRAEINQTNHGNLSAYDEILGWKGVPSGEAELVTKNNKAWLAHNRYGFRDIEHKDFASKKPVIVFLGDSFTWGYEVEFEEMFVNRLRDMLSGYELFNLAHRGYGTDQAFLTFENWINKQPLKLVVLMFSENDVEDNNALVRYLKPKPKYQLVENELVLVGVPVSKDEQWTQPPQAERKSDSWKSSVEEFLFRSHFLHEIQFRYKLFRKQNKNNGTQTGEDNKPDLTLTSRILEELQREVERRGAKFVVGLIPSKREIDKLGVYSPYQIEIAELCQRLGIEYLDIASDLRNTWYRTYYRQGSHWNVRGHKIAAESLYDFVTRVISP